jgi:hypothetical protein
MVNECGGVDRMKIGKGNRRIRGKSGSSANLPSANVTLLVLGPNLG